MENVIEKVYEYLALYGMNVVAAILIFFIGKWVARLIAQIAEKLMTRAKVDKTLIPFVKNIAYFALLVFVVIIALGKLGIQTTSFVAVIGAAGLAVGLALQGSLANFAAGFMLIIFKPFSVGDIIEAGGAAGTVQEVQIFNTILLSPDNKKIIVPNAKITADKITVHTRSA
jgi:small conductance mechanosensitive channel